MHHEEILINADYLYRKFIIIVEQHVQKEIFTIKAPPPAPRKRRV